MGERLLLEHGRFGRLGFVKVPHGHPSSAGIERHRPTGAAAASDGGGE